MCAKLKWKRNAGATQPGDQLLRPGRSWWPHFVRERRPAVDAGMRDRVAEVHRQPELIVGVEPAGRADAGDTVLHRVPLPDRQLAAVRSAGQRTGCRSQPTGTTRTSGSCSPCPSTRRPVCGSCGPGSITCPRGTRWTWHGLTWLALGGATSLDRVGRTEGVSWWPEEALTIADADRAVAGGPVDVMVTHDAPAGVTVPGAGSYLWREETMNASYLNRELLREVVDVVGPTHLFHGHFHTAYTADLDLGGDLHAAIRGLDKENAGLRNLVHLDLAELGADSSARRAAAAAWAGQHESR
jgi:hypothetical protein